MNEKPEMNFSKRDIAFAFATLVIGFLYWNLIFDHMLGAGVTVFALVIIAVSFVYLSKSGFRQNARSIVCLILAALSGVQFAIFDNLFIDFLNFLFLTCLFVYWICISTGRGIDGKLSVYMIGDAFKQFIIMPFSNYGCCIGGMKKGLANQKKGKGILAALIGVLIFMPLIAAVLNLLISADLAFESFVGRVFDFISVDKVLTYIIQFLFGIPVAFYLYGLIYGNVTGRHSDKISAQSVDNAAEVIKIAPKATIYSVLTVFNIIYLAFFAVQAAYFFSAFGGELPDTFTYAEYARRGFFELCMVAGINLLVLTVSHLTVKRAKGEESKALKVLTVMISLFTILLIVTALSKMAMYIDAYGLTQLRLFTSWFMVLLLFVFLIICVRQFRKFNSPRLIIAGFVVMFMLLSYGNADGLIAKYNIARFEAGTLPALDIGAIYELSDAAVPYVYDLYLNTDDNDPELRQKLESYIRDSAYYVEPGFRSFNYQRYLADEIRSGF